MNRRFALLAMGAASLQGCSKKEADRRVPPVWLAGTWEGKSPFRTVTFAPGELTAVGGNDPGVYDAEYFEDETDLPALLDQFKPAQKIRVVAVERKDGRRVTFYFSLLAGGMALTDAQGLPLQRKKAAGGA